MTGALHRGGLSFRHQKDQGSSPRSTVNFRGGWRFTNARLVTTRALMGSYLILCHSQFQGHVWRFSVFSCRDPWRLWGMLLTLHSCRKHVTKYWGSDFLMGIDPFLLIGQNIHWSMLGALIFVHPTFVSIGSQFAMQSATIQSFGRFQLANTPISKAIQDKQTNSVRSQI